MSVGATTNEAARLAELIRASESVVALTGAGISVESGLHSRKSLWRARQGGGIVAVDTGGPRSRLPETS